MFDTYSTRYDTHEKIMRINKSNIESLPIPKAIKDGQSAQKKYGSFEFQVGKQAEFTLLKSNPPVIK